MPDPTPTPSPAPMNTVTVSGPHGTVTVQSANSLNEVVNTATSLLDDLRRRQQQQ